MQCHTESVNLSSILCTDLHALYSFCVKFKHVYIRLYIYCCVFTTDCHIVAKVLKLMDIGTFDHTHCFDHIHYHCIVNERYHWQLNNAVFFSNNH